MKRQFSIGRILQYLILIIGAVVAVLPILVVFIGSFKSNNEFLSTSVLSLPKSLDFSNYKTAFINGQMLTGFKNTLLIFSISMVGKLLLGSMFAYVMSRFDFKLKKPIMALFMMAMLIPGITSQVATFQIIEGIGLFNTIWSVILLNLGTDVISIYVFLQYLDEIPVSLDESAYLDGANYFGIFWRIILPNLKAPIVTMLIISGVGVYNDFYNPFLYMPDRKLKVISTALSTGVIKLTKKRILVQDMYAIETLAHVDTLCLDKTGTLTEGRLSVESIQPIDDTQDITAILGSYLAASTDNNVTMQALRQTITGSDHYQSFAAMPFSSDRKWGAIAFHELGAVYLGAPEKTIANQQLPQIQEAQSAGLRVLVLTLDPHYNDANQPFDPAKAAPLAVLVLADVIRENAESTLAYLSAEGVDLKVISGDNPITVAAIAKRAGLPNSENYIDLSQLTEEADVRQAAQTYTVFGRVTPQQKKLLVSELKALGNTVAMTGDGVNDVLALREADVSIAMAAGDSAARQIANLVLLDSDFTTLPAALFEGRRVVNNVTKVSGIFFIKTIYSFLLSLLCVATSTAFPFIPIQITLLDLAIEGYPSFFLSFEEDKKRITGRYLPTALLRALPSALLVLLNYFAVQFLQTDYGWEPMTATTLFYYLLIGISCLAVIRSCLPLNPLRLFLIVTTISGTYIAAMLFHHILEVGFLTSITLPIFVGLMAINCLLQWGLSALATQITRRLEQNATA